MERREFIAKLAATPALTTAQAAAAMNFIDPEGFPITLGLSYAILTALIVTNMIRTKRAG